nr:immunoglobulin heavy chain junction region [Mus musculus]
CARRWLLPHYYAMDYW